MEKEKCLVSGHNPNLMSNTGVLVDFNVPVSLSVTLPGGFKVM